MASAPNGETRCVDDVDTTLEWLVNRELQDEC